MDLRETVTLALEALAANRIRSALTMLGVVMGVAAVIILVSLGAGARTYITSEITNLGTNLLIVTPGKTQLHGGLHPPGEDTVRKLTYEDAQTLKRRATLLKETVPIVLGSGRMKSGNTSRDTSVVGVTPEYLPARNLRVALGSFFSQEDVEARRPVAVLGHKVRLDLFGVDNPLGRFVTLADARYRVIGVMEPKGMSLGFDIDNTAFVPVRSAQELFATDRLFEILTSVRSADGIEQATAQIREILMRRHGNREDFTIVSQGAMLDVLTNVVNILTAALAGIGGISLFVGGIGIMNIMLVAVRERTREIGIRKAVGARRRDILGQFLAEAVALSLMGGTIGILLGVGTARLLPALFAYVPTEVSAAMVALAFLFSAAVGVFFGVYPARRAANLDPIVALRYE
ncbi:MAG TPA: ABC transporter permease [Candidatus Sulfotelmatobacter sp.]|nr:ABC transporter permease [Candidatus Sulfotelmatobacter sp.]